MIRRAVLILLVAVFLPACSYGKSGTSTAAVSTMTDETASVPAQTIEVPVQPVRSGPPKKYASFRELEWAAAWIKWDERTERSLKVAGKILGDRRALAVGGSSDERRLARALNSLRSCASDAVALGAPPTVRLAPVAVETAAACERLARAVALVDAAGRSKDFASDAFFAGDHLEAGVRKVRSFVPGLDEEIDPLPLLDRRSRRSRIQIRYTFAVSRLVGDQVTVTCFSAADWRQKLAGVNKSPGAVGGFVRTHTVGGNLAPVVCRWLDRFTYGRERPGDSAPKAYIAEAILTLGHEAQHTLGTRSERTAECFGLQRIAPLARALGADAAYARSLAVFFWARLYPLDPPTYRSAECRPNGKLDLHPKTPAWP